MELKSNLPSAVEETAENLLTKSKMSQIRISWKLIFRNIAYAIDSDSNIRLK